MKRAFTRAEVEAHFWTWFIKQEGEETRINAVWYIPGLGQPLWMVDCTTVSIGGTYAPYRYHSRYLTTQEQDSTGKPRLIPPLQVELPAGRATVAEEDRALELAEKEQAHNGRPAYHPFPSRPWQADRALHRRASERR